MQHHFVMALCAVLVEADFKTAKKKFLDLGVEEEQINVTFEAFKEAKTKNKIRNNDEKNIDFWAKKPWDDFFQFVKKVSDTKTKTEEVKTKANDGAEVRGEDDNWIIYKILTADACVFYGTNKWCIAKENSHHYDSYNKNNDFYFIISKNRDKSDKWHKIALQVANFTNKKTYWDANDKSNNTVPDELDIPDFKIDEFDIDIYKQQIEPDFKKIDRTLKKLVRSYSMDYSDQRNVALTYIKPPVSGASLYRGLVQYNQSNPIFEVLIYVQGSGDDARIMLDTRYLKGNRKQDPAIYTFEEYKDRLYRATTYLSKN